MSTLPEQILRILYRFAPLFSQRVWSHVQVLLAGAILAPGKRTVSSALRAMGLDQEKNFHRYHRVFSRAVWSGKQASRILLGLLVETFVPDGTLVMGIDESLERRRGKKIAAKGVYRDPVRSSRKRLVKTSGLRWACVTLLAEVPWARRVWALPFHSALAPSERYCREQGIRHKPITELAGQLLLLVRRWQPGRQIVAVGDGGYACLKLLERCRKLPEPITFVTRLRLDAALYEEAPPRKPRQPGRSRKKGERLPKLCAVAEDPDTEWEPITVCDWYAKQQRTVEIVSDTATWYSPGEPAAPIRWVLIRAPRGEFITKALLCTDLAATPQRIISWFVRRWQMESTFQEARQRLGFETQRHWSDKAIERTAPAMLALFSVVTLLAHQYVAEGSKVVRRTAWYDKHEPTFSDALALVRRELWAAEHKESFCGSPAENETVEIPREFMEQLTDAVCYAA